MSDISAYMKDKNLTIDKLNLKEKHLASMLEMIEKGTITGKVAKSVLVETIETGNAPGAVVKEKGLEQISDKDAIEKAVDGVIAENPKSVSDYKAGKQNAIMFLVGKVMAKTKGKANPQKVSEILKSRLSA